MNALLWGEKLVTQYADFMWALKIWFSENFLLRLKQRNKYWLSSAVLMFALEKYRVYREHILSISEKHSIPPGTLKQFKIKNREPPRYGQFLIMRARARALSLSLSLRAQLRGFHVSLEDRLPPGTLRGGGYMREEEDTCVSATPCLWVTPPQSKVTERFFFLRLLRNHLMRVRHKGVRCAQTKKQKNSPTFPFFVYLWC
jgi:hypothetical protein